MVGIDEDGAGVIWNGRWIQILPWRVDADDAAMAARLVIATDREGSCQGRLARKERNWIECRECGTIMITYFLSEV